jgi:metallo-beta-lactamase class B
LYDIFLGSINAMNSRYEGKIISQEQAASRRLKNEQRYRFFVHKHPGESYIKAEYIEIIHANQGAKNALDSLNHLTSEKEKSLGFFQTYTASLQAELGNFNQSRALIKSFRSSFEANDLPPAFYFTIGNYFSLRDSLFLAYDNIKRAVQIDSNHKIAQLRVKNLRDKLAILIDNELLRVMRINSSTYIHTSYLQTDGFGRVECNGLIIEDDGKVIVLDTPASKEASTELISFIKSRIGSEIQFVIPTHHHVDCLGGLDVFHEHGISSLSTLQTQILAKEDGRELPQSTFSMDTVLQVGSENLYLAYLGAGHTEDNIVAYYPKERVLFGGCLVKSKGAGPGNLNDANIRSWPNTVNKVKDKFSLTTWVVPGHGHPGGKELLDYTIDLFNPEIILIDEDGKLLEYSDHPGINEELIFELVASETRGYSYRLQEYDNGYTSIVILKDGIVELEFLGKSDSVKVDTEIIDRRRLEWIQYCNAHKASALVEALYSSDAIYYNHKPLVVGQEAITQDYQYMNNPLYDLNLKPLIVHPVASDLVFEIGQCSGSYNGKYILVWKKNPEDRWFISFDSNI